MRRILLLTAFALVVGCDDNDAPMPEPVDPNPVISAIADQSATVNASTGPIMFTVSDAGTRADMLVLTASADDDDLVADIIFGGTDSDRTVEVVPSENASGSTAVTVTVTDAIGLSSSISFDVDFVFEETEFAGFARDIFDDDATGEPRSINERTFNGIEAEDFSDLLDDV